MTETVTTDDDAVPFETTENGHYAVRNPVSGEYPDEVSMTFNGVTYTFTDFVTVGMSSKVRPDVLLFRECIVQ